MMQHQNLRWQKNGPDWFRLDDLNLNTRQFEALSALFVIWRQRSDSVEILRVGKGFLKKRLYEERGQDYITAISASEICVAWALLDASQQAGAQRYLIDVLQPKILPPVLPTDEPISVSLPWED